MNNGLDLRQIGNRIQKYRLERKLTQENLAELIGTNQKHLSRIECGYHSVNLNTIVALAKALNTSIDSLVIDFDNSHDESTLQEILNDIRGMSAKQLELLRDNINTLKKLDK